MRFSYIIGMGRLMMLQLHRVWIWSRDTMRRIIADIDTDGNGEIDWEERFGSNTSSDRRVYPMWFYTIRIV